jgi:DNA-directed RNA polymerase II subunit RPB2
MIEEDDVFNLLKNYFTTYGIAHIQIDAYNDFVLNGIPKIIEERPDIVINIKPTVTTVPPTTQKYVFSFGQVFVDKPSIVDEDRSIRPLYPSEARLRDLIYESAVYVDVITRLYTNDVMVEEHVNQRVLLCHIPSMVFSCKCNLEYANTKDRIKAGECEFDQGGYFIVKGHERVIVSQQRPNYNFVQVILQPTTSNAKYKYISEIRSVAEESGYSVLVQSMIALDDRSVYFSLPNIKEAIPAGIVFKALGFGLDDEISSFINMNYDKGKKYVKYILQDSAKITTREEALNFIGKYPMYAIPKEKQDAYAKQVVEMELFPHLGITATLEQKALFLGYMVNRLVCTVIGVRKDDDRDNVSNKRIETTGMLLYDLFRSVFDGFIKSCVIQLNRRPDIMSVLAHSVNMTKNIRHCFTTGNWGMRKSTHLKMGVSQVLNRMTFFATLSHLRHIVIPVGKEGKNAKIRQINTSQFSFICPAETPEGGTSGIVTNFSLLTKVSRKTSTIVTKEEILKCTRIGIYSKDGVKVLLNGSAVGSTMNPEELVQEILEKRSQRIIDMDTSVVFDEIDDEIRIYCDEGRLLRPLFVVRTNENGQKVLPDIKGNKTWDDLVSSGDIRYVDSLEVESSVIAMFPAEILQDRHFDFCEIHPSNLLGVCASAIPFPDHSQSPRNCYQSSMAKQALGVPLLSYELRSDTIMHVMDYPQRPLVNTKAANFLGYDELPSGANPIVAIMPKEGFNQEDSVILNQASIDRGMFRVTAFFSLSDEESRSSSSNFQTIEIPHPDLRVGKNNYSFLTEQGIIRQGVKVKKDDVIIGKVLTKINKDGHEEKKDISVTIKPGDEGFVHKVRVLYTPKGYKMVKITIRVVKIPEVGDKFASRAAQKGTCGMIFSQEDMPFTADGITPDIIINPHCIPSRMTINVLLETILGKDCAISGIFGDATPFSSSSTDVVEKLCNSLESKGYERHGLERMFNPYTGEEMDCKIFIGPTFYQRLKHMVSDKMHSRAKGNVTSLTRQPLEGRSRDGGLRFGEMERDCMIVHGVARFLKERLFDMSDPYSVIVCCICGMMSTSQTECKGCKEDKLCTINIPYAAKLLFQELNAMNIKTELMPRK